MLTYAEVLDILNSSSLIKKNPYDEYKESNSKLINDILDSESNVSTIIID